MAWVIDTKNFDGHVFRIPTRRRVSIQKNDHVVAFERHDGEVDFRWYAVVANVDYERPGEATDEDGERPLRECRIDLKARVEFETPRAIDDYVYSITKVYRFSKPSRHFLLPYVKLSDFDLETLVDGEVFWSRTAIGMFVNALPRERLLELMPSMLAVPSQGQWQAEYLREVWELVREFVEDEYSSLPEMFAAISQGLNELDEDASAKLCIGPGDPAVEERGSKSSDERPDNIAEQAARFASFGAAWKYGERSIAHALSDAMELGRARESRFLSEFKRNAWQVLPIENF